MCKQLLDRDPGFIRRNTIDVFRYQIRGVESALFLKLHYGGGRKRFYARTKIENTVGPYRYAAFYIRPVIAALKNYFAVFSDKHRTGKTESGSFLKVIGECGFSIGIGSLLCCRRGAGGDCLRVEI